MPKMSPRRAMELCEKLSGVRWFAVFEAGQVSREEREEIVAVWSELSDASSPLDALKTIAARGVLAAPGPAVRALEAWGQEPVRHLQATRCKACKQPFSPPIGLFGTNDVPCPHCRECYSAEPYPEEPDGYPVGTKLQAKGVKPGGHNVFFVAAGPIPEEYGDSLLLVESNPWITGVPALADYYDPRAFELASGAT